MEVDKFNNNVVGIFAHPENPPIYRCRNGHERLGFKIQETYRDIVATAFMPHCLECLLEKLEELGIPKMEKIEEKGNKNVD